MTKAEKKGTKTESLHPFQRLQTELSQLIAHSEVGERLPAEPELAKKLGVSRATLREAMRTFEGQGLVRRKQGVGTFIVGQSKVIESGLEVLESIETLAHRIGLPVSMGAMKVAEIHANQEESDALHVSEGTPLVKVSRVIDAEKRPVAFLTDILPINTLLESDLSTGFTGSVLDLLLRRGTSRFSKSFTDIQAVSASPEIAKLLEIQRGDVLLLFIARLYDENGEVVDYSSSYFLPGYFRFHVVRRVESANG
ncbi:MAG: GntR family transcriptional regulator [Anaerolineaceae bacterium]